MSFVSKGARAAGRPLRQSIRQPPRRFAGHEAGHGHGDAHHSGESAFHVAGGSGQEGFGKGFYFALATIPLFYVVYSVASSPNDNAITRLVQRYDAGREVQLRKDALHTTMMEQAAADRQLFAATPTNAAGPPLRNPEMFNFGSPWNVSAGHGTADLAALAKHYEEDHKKIEQERIARFQKQKGSVYDMPFEGFDSSRA
ncbi:hypothetical protein G647_02597 [Cladophialophora carrionii CBS 160.54]|uniref:NADH-ubiquinone oxidoreductase 17.8 kDa subunit n=1 Tax=Cladophialophora carrionii CBS 160.54 TaxID=1279043 RepID=V9DGK7_9EURO|nr:uncharacterized protein G647_02597 [Cladophialophora carrionii CBS 160.54]ETI25821.1 hypothetical protein G647_02597 [Cladophialophora carrionii CBS 160.54]